MIARVEETDNIPLAYRRFPMNLMDIRTIWIERIIHIFNIILRAAVFVEVTGVAKCRWCEHIQQKRMTYRGTEVYLYARKYFVGGPVSSVNAIDTDTDAPTTANTSTNVDENSSATGSGRGDTSAASATSTTAASSSATIRLQPGEHVYTFTCTLPANLPTSFEGTFGNIRYRAEVTVNVPLWPDKTFAEGFTVIRSVDLNALPDVRLRSHVERSDMFHSCCLLPCLQPKLIRLQASVARTGYTSGQTFEVAVAMENNSDISVRSLTVSLLRVRFGWSGGCWFFFKFPIDYECRRLHSSQVIIYCANERGNQHKTEHVRYSTVRTAGCKRQTVQQLRVLLQVPAGPPTDANSSRICKIRYEVEVRSDVGNCHDFPVARLPITIGTFPLLDSVPADDPRVSVISYDPGTCFIVIVDIFRIIVLSNSF